MSIIQPAALTLREIERKQDKRHEANEKRLGRVEVKLGALTAQMKLVIALLIANGSLNVLLAWKGR